MSLGNSCYTRFMSLQYMVKWCDKTAFTHDKFQRDLLLDGELLNFWALNTDHPPKKHGETLT